MMRFHFASLGKRHIKRFFKRSAMDNGLEWDSVIINLDNNDCNLQDLIQSARNI